MATHSIGGRLEKGPSAGAPPGTAGGPRRRPAPRAGRRRATRTHPALWLFPLPAVVLYAVFFAAPTVQAFQYAVTDWDGISAAFNSVGARNFGTIATNDDLFRRALTNNLQFLLVVVVLQTALALVLALLLQRNSRASTALRALYFLPAILSSVSVAFVWKFVYDPNFGLVNQVLGGIGLDGLRSAFLGDADKAIYWVAITQVWAHAGQLMIIFIAGLQQIPRELYESADLDGAGRWQRFRYITWPMIAPATAIVIAYTTIQSFKAFDLILGLGGNPPKGSLDILSTRIYTTFTNSQYGYAAAESVLFMIIIALVSLLQRRAVKLTQRTA
ncbi:carbohydrate ABC transporter permease [Streptomyces sp. WMMB 322]|uniref:carbohydrate ABC transporter permease n=1 Tax=Streptomyces sp. WMMB 322 TaxID=1286821 RepID=UPI0008239B0A|nr:sugar ABC transporter permease [Streptomyces sp. WMMB 322]SCK56536.1 carbohydrate ABC transporter membrane protein 1, CUT1 family [Streptomyces sp. WMMB 322]